MNIKQFEDQLDRFGADLDGWPADKARRAREFVSRSPEARGAHQAMLRLESGVYASRPKIDPARAAVIANRALRRIAGRPRARWFWQVNFFSAGPLPRVAFAAGATAFGFAIGLIVGSPGGVKATDRTGLPIMTASASDVLY